MHRCLRRIAALALPVAAAGALTAQAQDLVGCRLVGATLQCVPGVDESPQLQIKQMQQEISTDIQLEGVVQQRIDGLQQLVLNGDAAVGAALTATAVADSQAALAEAQYHWYKLNPGQRSWVLIEGAKGTTYVPAPVDIGQNIMVVAVVNQNGQVKRVASQPIGPVQP
jgi:predicted regulator of Ras-like GTPase activity (Roadblock/LC7/MglB family)